MGIKESEANFYYTLFDFTDLLEKNNVEAIAEELFVIAPELTLKLQHALQGYRKQKDHGVLLTPKSC